MIIISSVRLRSWAPWLLRFAFIMALIYALSAAFGWFESASYGAAPQPILIPTLFAKQWAGSPGAKANMARSEGMADVGYGAITVSRT